MATVWFNHLKPILDASSPPTSTPTPTPTSTPSSRLIAVSAPTNAAAAPSQPFTLPLTIDSDVSGLQIFAYQFRLTFNPAVLQVTGVANSGTLSSNWQITEHHGTPGQIDVAGYGTTPLAGTGVLLNLAFQVTATPGTETDLTLSHFLFNEGSPVAAPHNGHISVRLLGTAGLVTYTLNAQPVPDVLLTLSRANQFTTTSSSTINGEYQLVAPQIGNYTLAPSKQGSEGNAITAYDASLVARCVVGALDIDTCPLEASDSSNNGQIAAYDAALIARYVVHLPTTNSLVGQWKFSPPVRLYQPLDRDFTGQNFNAILVGDVSGNWAATASSLQAAATPVHLRLVSAPTTDGQPLQSTLRLDRAQRTDLFAYQVVIAYDPAVLQVLQVADAARLPGWSFVANADTPGQLQVVGYGTTPLSVDGDLLNLTFQQITTAVDTPFIGISTAQINEEQTSVVIETPAPQRTLFLPLVIR